MHMCMHRCLSMCTHTILGSWVHPQSNLPGCTGMWVRTHKPVHSGKNGHEAKRYELKTADLSAVRSETPVPQLGKQAVRGAEDKPHWRNMTVLQNGFSDTVTHSSKVISPAKPVSIWDSRRSQPFLQPQRTVVSIPSSEGSKQPIKHPLWDPIFHPVEKWPCT